MEVLATLCVSGALFIHALIALYDFAFFRIPNGLVLILFAVTLFWGVTTLPFNQLLYHLGVFSGMLVFGFGLFAFGWIGGGDAKYLAVSSLWIGLPNLASFIFWVAIAGGLLSVVYLLFKQAVPMLSDRIWSLMVNLEKKFKPLSYVWMMSEKSGEGQRAVAQKSVPYGIAIAIGSWIILLGGLSL